MKKIAVKDEVLTADFAEMLVFTQQELGEVPEFRKAKGRQINLRGALTLAVVAMAAGKTSYRGMARFAKQREKALMPLLGLKRAPSYSTFRRIIKGVVPESMRKVLQRTSAKMLEDKARQVVVVDAKTRRGCVDEQGRQVQVAAATEQNTGVELDAMPCPGEGTELPTGRQLVKDVLQHNSRVVLSTGDALYAD